MDVRALAKVLGSVGALVFSVWWMGRGCTPPVSAEKNHAYIGRHLAQEVCARFGGERGRYVVLGYEGNQHVLNVEISAFLEGMKSCGSWTLERVERVPVPGAGDNSAEMEGGVASGEFATLLASLTDVDMVVSFIGLPLSASRTADRRVVSGQRKLVVANGRLDRVAEWVELGEVDLAVVFKSVDMGSFQKQATDPAAWFERFYEVVPHRDL